MRMHKKLALTLALALALTVPVGAAGPEDDTVQQRQEDLDALYTTLVRAHPDLFANTPEEVFLTRKAEIEGRLETDSGVEFLFDLQSLAALAGDSHTSVAVGGEAIRQVSAFPVALSWRAGRWYLTTSPAEQADLLGREVTALNGQDMDAVVEAFGAVLSADNPVKLRRQYRQVCNVADYYVYLGLAEAGEPLTLTLEGGETLSVEPVSYLALGELDIARLSARAPRAVTAEQDRNYVAFSLDERTYYIQYNTCQEDPELPMERFAAQVAEELARGGYGRILVDLRNNGGGSDGVIWPLLEVLRREMDGGAEVVGLIGETTFSSAIINAVELQEMGAVLVGDVASGSVDHFGSVYGFSLPNSGVQVGVSSRYIDLGTLLDADAGRGVVALEPDILVQQTMEDTLAGRDTAVEWLATQSRRLEQEERPGAPLTRGRFAALLYQAAGSPAVETGAAFADTLGIEWYLPALDWAAAHGVVAGTGDGAVQASRPITRQEAAVMLVRTAQLLGREWDGEMPALADGEQIAPWAREAAEQAVALSLMDAEDGLFLPEGGLTRRDGEELVARLSR